MRRAEAEAAAFAAERHAGQTYDGDLPYTVHLGSVAGVLARFGINDDDMLAAAWLHDVAEDTATTIDEVRDRFGARVAELVAAVTDEPGQNRAVRARRTYPKIRSTPGALGLKLADRIANVEHGGPMLDMYRREYSGFRSALFATGHDHVTRQMWSWLDALMLHGSAGQ